jgi:hypothetical protein
MKKVLTSNQIEIRDYLSSFKGKSGIYIIKAKKDNILKEICQKLNYEYKSSIAYVGKAKNTKTSDLYNRTKQEMGWSNFEGATFMRKVGLFLDFDIKDKKNKELQLETRDFICDNFSIECIALSDDVNLLEKESEYIVKFKPCLNVKKNNI